MNAQQTLRRTVCTGLLFLALNTQAADIVWTNTAGGDWGTAANWSPNQVPGGTDNAWITNNGTYIVSITANATVGSLTAGAASGTQSLSLSSGTFTINGASLLDTNCNFTISFGSPTLADYSDVTVNGTLNWSSGQILGSGKMMIGPLGAANLSGSANLSLSKVIQNDGTVTWTGAGTLNLNGGVINNNGSFTLNSDSALTCWGNGGAGVFNNNVGGTFAKQGSGTATFTVFSYGVTFNNSGTVDIQAGTLTLQAGGINNNAVTIQAAGTLSLPASYSYGAASSLSGSGTVTISSGTHTFPAGTFTPTGAVNLAGSTTTINNTFTPAVLGALSSGTITFNAPQSFSNLTLSGGTLDGSGDVTITGTANWTVGTMAGSGKTIIGVGATLNVNHNAGYPILSRVLENSGTLNWSGYPYGWMFNGGTLNNLAGGVVNASAATSLQNQGGVNAINNAGTWNTTANSTFIYVPFNNSGTVDVQGGTLTLNAGFTQTAGSFVLSGGNATSSSTMQFLGGMLAGTGTLTASVLSSGIVSPGASPGLLTISGNYTQTTNGALSIEIAGTSPGTAFDRLAVTGTATLAGTLNITLTNGFYSATNASFGFLTCASRSGTFGSFNYPSNDVGMIAVYSPTNAAVQIINTRPVLPVFTGQTNDELVPFSMNAAGTDADVPAQTLTYALTNSPAGATIDPASGLISWTPTEAQGPMVTNITVLVTDNGTPNLTVSRTFQIVVNEVNVPPALTLPPNQSVDEQTTFNATATATDSDIPANPLTFELVSGPPGLTVSTNGDIAWTPTEAQGPNTYTVTVRVTDSNTNAVNEQHLSAAGSFQITVNEVNLPPVLTVPADQIVIEETPLNVSASATDPDIPANPLTFSLLSPPDGMTIDPVTGAINWTPSEAQGPSTNVIAVVVTDYSPLAVNAQHLSVTNTFIVVVLESNRPPVLTVPADQTIHATALLSVMATATDPDIPTNTLSFGLASGPAGLSVSGDGLVTWRPPDALAGTTNEVSVWVLDNGLPAMGATQSFNVIVVSRPILAAPTFTNGEVALSWSAIPGTSYRLQFTPVLEPTVWADLAGDVTASGTNAAKADSITPDITNRVYRVQVLP